MKHCSYFVAFVLLFLTAFRCSNAAPRFRRILPYMDDKMVSSMISSDMAPHDALYEEDAVFKWMKSASDVSVREDVRVRAIGRLYDYRQKRIEIALIPLLKDSSMAVRAESAKVLGKMKFPSSAIELIDALRFSYGSTRKEIRKALKEITGQDFGNNYNTWKKWYRRNRREYR